MRVTHLIPLAVTAVALVIPDETTANQLRIQPKDEFDDWTFVPAWEDIRKGSEKVIDEVVEKSQNVLDVVLDKVSSETEGLDTTVKHGFSKVAGAVESWLNSAWEENLLGMGVGVNNGFWPVSPQNHHHHHDDGDHHGHHPGHGHKPNQTIYQLISKSKYTTKLAKLIDEDADLVRILNSTESNYTVFAPTDKAFDKIPEHGDKPSKELIKKTLLYHISPDYYPACRVLVSHTIPTLLKEKELGDKPQRISLGISFKGLTLNYYARVVAVDILATNGVIHGIDDVLFIPPEVLDVFEILPAQFSTLLLGLHKTGLYHDFRVTATAGQTFFAPTNYAFEKLPLPVSSFLFSEHGLKYLKAILKYHVVGNQTLYSDAYYDSKHDQASSDIPKGIYHIDLPTLLDGRTVSVDIARYGGFITMKLNAFNRVIAQDGVVKDGVIQSPSDVLIPPKKPGSVDVEDVSTLTVGDLIERLDGLVEDEDFKRDGLFDAEL